MILIGEFPSMTTDRHTKEKRKKNMQAVRSSGSKIEQRLQKALWKKGYRYRKNYDRIVGKPDIAFVSSKVAIFCDSEFWHGFDWENRQADFKSNKAFWLKKIHRNIERDLEINEKLKAEGWIVLRFWGKQIDNDLEGCLSSIEGVMKSRKRGTM
jgi:DNA mismatch endonuclease Vsr